MWGSYKHCPVRISVFVSRPMCVFLRNMSKSVIIGSQVVDILSFIYTATFFQNCTSLQCFQQCKRVVIPPDPHPHFPVWSMCVWDWNTKTFRTHPTQTHPPLHFQMHKIETEVGEVRGGSLRSKTAVRNTNSHPHSEKWCSSFQCWWSPISPIQSLLKQLSVFHSQSLNIN